MSCHLCRCPFSFEDVKQFEFSENFESTKFDHLTREDLIQKTSLLESELFLAFKEIYKLKNQNLTDEQLKLVMTEQLGELQNTIYGASSERYKKSDKPKEPKAPAPRPKLPSERYPNIPLRNELVPFDDIPMCDACGKALTDSGMTEESEQLNVIPKKFEIINWVRPKFRCSCHGCIKLPPVPRRIIEGSSYSDKMIIDVVASKYCDLIPIQRYVAMAARSGLKDLPPQSLIELTHQFAQFVKPVYEMLKNEVKSSRVLHADETPHKMLEGSDTNSWYLWGFSTPRVCFLECHSTRSGDVASDILKTSSCEILMSDVFSGYGKAVRITNLFRQGQGRRAIQNANCNAHARRYFIKSLSAYPESKYYLDQYHDIYQLESQTRGKPPDEILKIRSQMTKKFEAMLELATKQMPSYPTQLKFGKALNYFIENYDGLTLFLEHADVAIDNNLQERLLRSHVVGRKTWYGTHSERGAETAAIIFSIIETCKLNQVNPREYLEKLVQDLLQGQNPYTPKDFADLAKN
jgi:transposase